MCVRVCACVRACVRCVCVCEGVLVGVVNSGMMVVYFNLGSERAEVDIEEISCFASMCLALQILSAVDRAGILGNAFALSR